MITCGIATLKDREESFKKTIESIYSQVDKIIAVLNYYGEIPDWIKNLPKIKAVIMNNELMDSGKFLEVDKYQLYYFSIDDDLFYPSNYCQYLISKIKKYHCIVTLHGKCFDKRPIVGYHRSFTTNIHCLHTCNEDIEVHVGGSGTMAFDTREFKLSVEDFKYPGMADIWVSKRAKEQNVKIMALAHRIGYLRYMKPPGETLWQKMKRDPVQTEILKSFLP